MHKCVLKQKHFDRKHLGQRDQFESTNQKEPSVSLSLQHGCGETEVVRGGFSHVRRPEVSDVEKLEMTAS